MLLSAYLLVPGSHFGAMWRHPYSETDFCDRTLYEGVARSLDRYGFDYAFVPESLAVPMSDDGVWQTMTRRGASGAVRHDPALLVSPMIGVTRRLRFTVTLSTTFMEPYHLARMLSTLNHFSNGRMAWNVVTSAGASNAVNFAHLAAFEHGDLYERAEEVLSVCHELWRSWDEDALVADKRSGIYANDEKIRQIDHKGRYFDVRGPLTLPHGALPTLMAAGVSPKGRDFAARWAEVIFAIQNEPAAMRELRDDVRARAERMGRAPHDIRLMAAVQPVIGETREIAEARAAHLDSLVAVDSARSYLTALLGFDLSGVPGDAPCSRCSKAGASGPPSMPAAWPRGSRSCSIRDRTCRSTKPPSRCPGAPARRGSSAPRPISPISCRPCSKTAATASSSRRRTFPAPSRNSAGR